MRSAQTKWGAKQGATLQAPAPVSRDAFEHLMHAAAANKPKTPATGRGGGGARGGGGRGGAAARGGGRGGGRWAGGSTRPLASYKTIAGSRIVVDGFTSQPVAGMTYFLSHFHSDHYVGLTKQWSVPVYCSEVTARLVARPART